MHAHTFTRGNIQRAFPQSVMYRAQARALNTILPLFLLELLLFFSVPHSRVSTLSCIFFRTEESSDAEHVAPDCSARRKKQKSPRKEDNSPNSLPKKKKKRTYIPFTRYTSETETRVRKKKQSASFLPLAFHRGDDDRRAALDDDDDRELFFLFFFFLFLGNGKKKCLLLLTEIIVDDIQNSRFIVRDVLVLVRFREEYQHQASFRRDSIERRRILRIRGGDE